MKTYRNYTIDLIFYRKLYLTDDLIVIQIKLLISKQFISTKEI